MKLHLLLFALVAFVFGSLQVNAQAKRYAMFEHFTQASCGPCAAQNPAFQAVYENNTANAHHVAYHTSWPGTDPMNAINPGEVQVMVLLYGVTGVPDMIHDGVSVGGPTGVSQNLIDKEGGSPIRLLVEHNNIGDSMVMGSVTIQTVGDKPAGTFILRGIAVESEINYTAPPGSNGERDFPNVFRQFVIDSTAGRTIDLPETGEEMTIEFSYPMNAAWSAPDMYTLAYVQNVSNDVVLNSGASNDPVYHLVNTDDFQFKNAGSATTTFNGNVYSTAANEVIVSISNDASDEWTSTVSIDGNEVSDGDTIMLVEGDAPVMLTVEPGTASGVANFRINIHEPGTNANQSLSYFVINNVKDLVIVSDNAASGANPVDFGAPYLAALENVSTTEKGSMGHTFLPDAENASALMEVENIYYSIGWSFPALNDDVTRALIKHLNRGGNLMIAGQDVGWDIMSMHAQSNGTALQRILYTDYLKADFIDDGSSANSQFYPDADDNVYPDVAATTVNTIYTAANTYPDQIDPIGDGANTIFRYSTTKSAGIKVQGDGYKVVYLGIGLEQVSDAAVADEIFSLTHDWFHGLVSNKYVDAAFAELGNAFPNPAHQSVQITFGDALQGELDVIISDVSGKTISTQRAEAASGSITLDVSNFAAGAYYYQLSNGNEITTAKKFVRN